MNFYLPFTGGQQNKKVMFVAVCVLMDNNKMIAQQETMTKSAAAMENV